MTRAEARALWARIVAGDLEGAQYDPVDLHAWLRAVARKVLEADDTVDEKQRPYNITAAVGLRGPLDQHADLRDHLKLINEFEPAVPFKRGEERQQLIALARAMRPEWDQVDDDTVFKRVQRLLD